MTSWEIKKYTLTDYEKLVNKLDISPALIKLLIQRGIDTEEKIRAFLYGDLRSLSDSYLLSGLDKAVARIKLAIKEQEKVVIYGDYDVDGICSTVILLECFSILGLKVDYYVPNRFSEGYGLNEEAIIELANNDYDLVITVDCGIASVKEIDLANSLGLDFIITDHHTPSSNLPNALAIVNPKLDNNEANYNLCGAGVAYQLALALTEDIAKVRLENIWLDLAALATVADIVPLMGDNRIIVKQGLKEIMASKRMGIKALIEAVNLADKELNSWHIGYILAPRLNAAGRMEDASIAIELLQATNYQLALKLVHKLVELNSSRRSVEEQIYKEAIDYIENNINLAQEGILIVVGEDWHHGVIGIVASRLVDKYHRPTIIITFMDDEGRGSGRSIAGFDLYTALEKVEGHLVQFGGHKLAIGLSISRDNLLNFKNDLLASLSEIITEKTFVKKEIIDLELQPDEINEKMLAELKLLEPFGEGNAMPKFLCRGLEINSAALVGKNKEHFKFKTLNNTIDAIAFGKAKYATMPWHLLKYDIAFNLEENNFLGRKSLQLKVFNIKPTITPDKPYLLYNLAKHKDILQNIVEELADQRPVTLLYPTYRTLVKHYQTLQAVFNPNLLKPLHGNIYIQERNNILKAWQNGQPYIFLMTKAYLDYFLKKDDLPAKLHYIINIWADEVNNLDNIYGVTINDLLDTRKIRLSQAELNLDSLKKAVIYTNRPKTIDKLANKRSDLVVLAGEGDYQERSILMEEFLKSEKGILLLDGAYDFYSNDFSDIDTIFLADVPFSYYESLLTMEQISATDEVRMITLFDNDKINNNKAYLSRNYPDVNTIKEVLNYFKSLQTNFVKSEIGDLNAKVSKYLKREKYSFNILPVLWILADLGLCEVSKQGNIMTINFLKVNNAELDISSSPYYLEGRAEKMAFLEWEQMITNG
ncbi:MAG: single-stranded-DNA-specific exonuclease RecJ [Syntrophomonadaceae bacterium]|nr:single-stranded-DNA-specific exonuclease RecJ [Syntrophomonadaceae bacterium]